MVCVMLTVTLSTSSAFRVLFWSPLAELMATLSTPGALVLMLMDGLVPAPPALPAASL